VFETSTWRTLTLRWVQTDSDTNAVGQQYAVGVAFVRREGETRLVLQLDGQLDPGTCVSFVRVVAQLSRRIEVVEIEDLRESTAETHRDLIDRLRPMIPNIVIRPGLAVPLDPALFSRS
jgi:hypothetical protein